GSPVIPVPESHRYVPLAAILVPSTATQITNSMITDLRPGVDYGFQLDVADSSPTSHSVGFAKNVIMNISPTISSWGFNFTNVLAGTDFDIFVQKSSGTTTFAVAFVSPVGTVYTSYFKTASGSFVASGTTGVALSGSAIFKGRALNAYALILQQ